MKDIFVLTKILLKNSLGGNSTKKSSAKAKIGTTILILFVLVYFVGFFGILSYEIIDNLLKIRQEEIFITFSLLLIVGFTLFRTIITAINVLYFSKDVEFLLPFPIKPVKIVFAKFNVMLISNYVTELIILGIPYAIYCYLVKLDIIFLLYSFLIMLVLPIIPMIIASIIIVFIMRFTSFLKNKDIVQYLSIIITIGLIFAIQMVSASSNQTTDFILANKLVEINGYSSVLSKYFFTVEQSVKILTATEALEAIKNLGLLYLESIGIYVFVVFVISKMYLKSALRVASSGIKASKLKMKNINKKSIGISYVVKEFKALFRTPVYLFQCVLPAFVFPILFSIPMYQELSKLSEVNAQVDIAKVFSDMFSEVLNGGFGFGIVLVIINFLYMFNFTSITSVSREGENAIFMKYIPISLSKQYKYKSIPGIIINFVPLIYVLVVLRIIFPKLSILFYIKLFWIALLCNILLNYFSVIVDVLRPKLHWTSEYAVVKQNMNMLYGFIMNLILIGIVIGVSSYIDNQNLLIATLSLIIISLLLIFEFFLNKYQRQIFRKIS